MSKTERIAYARDFIACDFESKQSFREGWAEKRPDQAKHVKYATGLAHVAEYVQSLPDDDPTLLKLADCEELWVDGSFTTPCGEAGEQFEHDKRAVHCEVETDEDCRIFLEHWANLLIEAAKSIVFCEGCSKPVDRDDAHQFGEDYYCKVCSFD